VTNPNKFKLRNRFKSKNLAFTTFLVFNVHFFFGGGVFSQRKING
jgi:hypothetical protein